MFVTYPIKRDKLGNQIKSFEFSKIRDFFRFELTRKFVFQKHWTAYGMMVQEGPKLENQSLASISSLAASVRICIGFFFSPADSYGSLIFGIRGSTVDLAIPVMHKAHLFSPVKCVQTDCISLWGSIGSMLVVASEYFNRSRSRDYFTVLKLRKHMNFIHS